MLSCPGLCVVVGLRMEKVIIDAWFNVIFACSFCLVVTRTRPALHQCGAPPLFAYPSFHIALR